MISTEDVYEALKVVAANSPSDPGGEIVIACYRAIADLIEFEEEKIRIATRERNSNRSLASMLRASGCVIVGEGNAAHWR